MPTEWTVKQGDCLSVIAEDTGFFWETIWNHPKNQQLRRGGRGPTVLKPGDVVFVPDKRPGEEICETTRRHRFRLKGVPVKFKARILDSDDKPRAGLSYTLEVDGSTMSGVIPDDGIVSKNISPKAQKAKLTVKDPNDGDEIYEFQLGHLNPIEDIKGVQSRLKSLGYLDTDPSGTMDEATETAIARFQGRAGLPATGEADASTRDALLAAHGS